MRSFVFVAISLVLSSSAYAQFVNVAPGTDAAVTGNKDGGLAWGDFNNDGCLDLLINTADATQRSRLLQNNCSAVSPELVDVTTTLAPGLLRNNGDRSALLVDLNNDGYLDIVRNNNRRMEIYFNNGPIVPPMIGDDYTFGTGATLTPNIVRSTWSMLDDFNTEGIGAVDADGDGFLDLLVENHDDGIALMLNGGDGTFSQTPAAGLPGINSTTDGDYLSVVDIDGDGNMDVIGRKNGGADIYYGNGDGTFTADLNFDQPASNGNKGGVTPCDIDGDGRLDLFWTDAGTNQFWRQSAARTWTATGQPASGIAGNIDGASCGDVDNDGDMDLFLTSSGTDHLFLNDGSGVFTRNNLGIAGATDSEGSQFADYDNDGDLDLAVNTDGAAQLWENQTGGSDFLMVTPVVRVAGGRTRPETGVTARIVAAFGAAPFQGPITQLDGGSGHGVGGPGEIHLGLGDGNAAFYTLTVKFPGGAEVTRCVQPSALTDQSILVLASDRSTLCDDQDGDDIPDVVDVDDDNDGILDVTEVAGITGDPSADNDGDGVPNYADPDHTPGGCASVAGVCTSLPTAIDIDEDGIPNHLDRDADGDGLTDVRESGGDDSNGDGRPDACTATNALGACVSGALAGAPTNTDGGQPDYLDPDSDGDGLLDRVEAFDTNGNGTLNGSETTASGNDADNDGIDNAYDPDFAGGDPVTDADATALDADGNGTPNWQQVCGDAYVRGAEACDTGSASATCTAMCLRTDGEDCTSAGQCDAAICTAGICGLVVSVDLADPDAGGPLTTTTTTPSGTSSGFAPGSTVTVRVTGPGGFDATCMATVAASGAWMCSAAITGLDQGATYTAVASGTSAGISVMDSETFVTGDCAGLDEGDVCDGGVCDADGGGGSCVVCADTMSGAGLDDGCAAAAPLCVSVGGAPTCVACVDSTNGGTDDGCGAAGPVCDDSNAASPVCVVCEDNESGDMADNGCMAPNALCAEPVGMAAMCVECLMDSQCTVAGEVCGGDNTCVPGCNEMSDCEGTPLPICDLANRTCVECLTDDECLGSQVCSAGGMCVFGDSDMDNVPDDVDLDDDNDGILDADELGGDDLSDDSNDNGVPDYNDAALQACDDMNGDLMCDSVLPQFDFDGDGIPNHLDRDADGDGLVDTVEGGGVDDDGNGIVDGFSDANGNGLSDALEADALPIPNTDEAAGPDFLDLDSDDDGLTDTVEGGGTDDDGNGQPDGAAADTNLDGIDDSLFGASALPAPDSDGDDTPDYQDVDSDDDGIIDATEAFDDDMDGNPDVMASGADTDMDGLDDAFDPDCIDAVCGGVIGVLAPQPNSDSDMLPDWRDVDSDADGITDGVECPVPSMCSDSDMDGTPDYLEVDADGDGLADSAEGHDADHDGTPDVEPSGTDTDMDGLDDAFDGDCADAADCGGVIGIVAPTPDLDMDGRPDFQDADDDGDSILTATEIQDAADYMGPATTPSDVDEDGLPNWYDTDSDGDDTPDLTEDTRPALDGDLDDNDILDYLDPGFAPADTDGDGIIDALARPGVSPTDDTCPDSDGDGQPDFDDVDDDNDGVLTRDEYAAAGPDDGDIENDHDADNDGVPNHLDIDADNDGIPDLWENGGAEFDVDGDGQVDAAADDDGDGLLAVFDADDADKTNIMTDEPTNTDGSGPADYLDLDSDDDGLLDILEANGTDADSDGRVDDAADADMDGLADIVDPGD
ncbi:MAG: FG-GAP-like repeat-containing protein, partial [Polyangiales bacterium]